MGDQEKHEAIAVLDIRGAYYSVPKGILLEILKLQLSPLFVSMIKSFLKPNKTITVGQDNDGRAVQDFGVPQGSRLSPTTFNLYMNELSDMLTWVPRVVSTHPCNLFAYDVILMTKI